MGKDLQLLALPTPAPLLSTAVEGNAFIASSSIANPSTNPSEIGVLMEPDSLLPSEIWLQILELGIRNSILFLPDISSFSISCKYFSKLTNDNPLWSLLLTLDFPLKSSTTIIHGRTNQFLKSLYKYRLKRSIQRKIGRIQGKVLKDEFLFNLFKETIKGFRAAVVDTNEKVEDLSAQFVLLIEACEMQYLESIERCHRRMLLMNEELMEFSAELIRMVEQREIRQAGNDQVTLVEASDPPTHLLQAPTSNTPAEILVYLEAKVDHLIFLQQRVLYRQQRQQCRVDDVLRRRQEHDKLLMSLNLHLDSFGPTEVEDGGEDDNSDDSEDDTEDDDVDADAVLDYVNVITDNDDDDGDMEIDDDDGGDIEVDDDDTEDDDTD